MPPKKKQQQPQLQPQPPLPPTPQLEMKLRGGRATHPGAPDMPKLKRSTAQVAAEKAEKEREKEAKAATRQIAIQKVATLENEMMLEDTSHDLDDDSTVAIEEVNRIQMGHKRK